MLHRLEVLEARQRRLRCWCWGLSALLAGSCIAAAAAPPQDQLRTHRLVLVNEEGAERAVLGIQDGGAMLTMKGSDGKSTLVVGAGLATWTESFAALGFSFSSGDAGRVDLENGGDPQLVERAAPWSGLMAWTGDEKDPGTVTSVCAGGPFDGFFSASQDCGVSLAASEVEARLRLSSKASEALFSAAENAAHLSLEHGPDPFGYLTLNAGKEGAWIGGTLDDEYSFDLTATKGKVEVGLSLEHPALDEDPDRAPAVRLRAQEDRGSIELRSGEHETYRAP